MVEKNSNVPVYLQLQRTIEEMIDSADYGPGDHIPSERALADQFNVNRLTVRKAIDRLVSSGRLERNSTNGTRIPVPRLLRPVEPQNSGGIARVIQLGGGTPSNRLLHFELAKAQDSIANHLSIPSGSDIFIIRRLWRVDDTPIIIETSYIPASYVPGLEAEDLTSGQSLYGILKERFGIVAVYSTRTISVHTPTSFEEQTLRLPPHSSTLLVRLLVEDADGRPIEYVRSVNHPVHVNFRSAAPSKQR
ncbi:putative transcriptional regulator, GntR [Agrobacterium tumefaciens str. Kerr 14]|uniref:Putative transcriptional regulator, GntR n=1 Tax=Agrobacterium tumefaciens str. Kerr 14 TaxID=1183424 RepID=A0A1S7SAV4_AGRTU|nr:GntR family transcriptional regulator [Agrobacterium tumefaciens]CUX65704.1 putative transcriptional regulator, GntR [Agrobacterium tumefaciens str. Kerr 14]